MKLPGLIHLSLLLIFVSNSEGGINIYIPRLHISAKVGSTETIQCNFSYPSTSITNDIQVFWKRKVGNHRDAKAKETPYFIYHPNTTYVLEEYKDKTFLIGNKLEGDCSLQIKNITQNESNIYVRVYANKDRYSFYNASVTISLTDGTSDTPNPDVTPKKISAPVYIAIFVTTAAILIIVFAVGVAFCIKHRRSKSFTREESGYYANFSRTSSNQAKGESSSKRQDNKELQEPKAIDEPIYINIEAHLAHMDQGMDHTDSIYANVDYSK